MPKIGSYELTGRRIAGIAGAGLAAGSLAANMACSSGSTRTVYEGATSTSGAAVPGGGNERATTASSKPTPSEGSPSSATPASVYQEALTLHRTIIADCGKLVTRRVAVPFYENNLAPGFNYWAFNLPVSAGGPEAKFAEGAGKADAYVNNNVGETAEVTESGGDALVKVVNTPNGRETTYLITPRYAEELPTTKGGAPKEVSPSQAATFVGEGATVLSGMYNQAQPAEIPAMYITPAPHA
jgi:hypothetical protein